MRISRHTPLLLPVRVELRLTHDGDWFPVVSEGEISARAEQPLFVTGAHG